MSNQAKPIILVVDEHPDDLARATQILNPRDYIVATANCHDVAVAKAKAFEIDLILCDTSVNARQQDADLISEIIRIPDRDDVPIIFSSAGQAAGVIRRQHYFGGAYHIKKPFDATVLITLIERSLWMPHLVQTHLNRPHFDIGPIVPTLPSVSIPVVNSQAEGHRL